MSLKKMSVSEYKSWMRNPMRKKASLPSFHKNNSGFERTLNVLEGDAKPSSVAKWNSFRARWSKAGRGGWTEKEIVAVKNWGLKPKK